MATETLAVNLLLNANQYKREAQSAATATGKIAGSAGQATTATGKLQGQMGTLATTAKFAVAGIATAAVADFARDSIAAASNLNESINAVNVTFGEAADGVHEIGESAADSFGMSERAFNEFAVRFSAFAKNIAEGSGRDVVDIVDEMSTRVADFASVHNLSLEEAAQVAQSTLAGETEVFRRFGGDVSAAAVQAKGLELGLSGVGDELTEGEKQLIRYELFMEQTSDTAGDFARTSGDLANAQRRVNSNLEDAQAKIGQAVVPVLGDMAAALADVLGFLDDLSVTLPATGEEFSVLEGFVKASAGGIFGVISLVKDAWTGFFGDAAEAQKEHIGVTEESIGAANRHRGSIDNVKEGLEDLGGIEIDVPSYWEETQTAVENTKARLEEYEAALRRLTDPVFRAIDDQNRLIDAHENYQGVLDDSESSTRDVEDALFALVAAQQEANFSAADLPESMFRTEQAFSDLAAQLGLTEDELAIVISRMDELDGATARAMVEVTWASRGDLSARDALVAGAGVQTDSRVFRQHGGPVTAGSPYVVGEAGPELFIPDSSGQIIPNNATTGGLALSGGDTHIHVYGDVNGEQDFIRKIQKAGVDIQRLGW